METIERTYKSSCGKYQYHYRNIWDKNKPLIMFICLNPGLNDGLLSSLIQHSQNLGYGGFYLCNLFAFITKKDYDLTCIKDPIGKDNDKWLKKISKRCSKVIFAWGVNGKIRRRCDQVEKMFKNSYVLSLSEQNYPKYPTFVKGITNLKPYKNDPDP